MYEVERENKLMSIVNKQITDKEKRDTFNYNNKGKDKKDKAAKL